VLMGSLPKGDAIAAMKQGKCYPALVKMFEQCQCQNPTHRPRMSDLHVQLQELLVLETRNGVNLQLELKKAMAQDLETYNHIWTDNYANSTSIDDLLSKVQTLARSSTPTCNQVSKDFAELETLADKAAKPFHTAMRSLVEHCGGTYVEGPRKKLDRTRQKVEEELQGDYSRMLDLERGTGLFRGPSDFERCLTELTAHPRYEMVRIKDRLTTSLESGYRDVLLNVRDREWHFIFELQLNFDKMAAMKSQTHRFYELSRVMKDQLPK